MQYFRPGGEVFVGDAMPCYHDGVFRLYYLRDEGHHQARGGLGGHQWAQASTRDLVHWEHHPLALPLTRDDEGSICTGSVFVHEGVYHAFYATRRPDRTQHLGLALSHDGVHFAKQEPNPLASPLPGYHPNHYRDPVVFQDPRDGRFHLLASALLTDWPLADRGGCLAHLVSDDLRTWQVQAPFLVPGLHWVPECPDHFAWNGWYYLLFSNYGVARYRMSRTPLGPWTRPPEDTLDGPAARVMKTAAFRGGRRLGVAWLGTRQDGKDDGRIQFAGNAVFRELVQRADGTLDTVFPPELTPAGTPIAAPALAAVGPDARVAGRCVHLAPRQGLATATLDGVPPRARLRLRVTPAPGAAGSFGLRLRAADTFDSGYDLAFAPVAATVNLRDQWLYAVRGLDQPFTLEVVLHDDILDVCVDRRRTVLDRAGERRGARLFFYAQDAAVTFELLEFVALG